MMEKKLNSGSGMGNPFYDKIKTYIGKPVKVAIKSGKVLEGTLLAVNFATLNFAIESKEGDYVFRDDVSYIFVPKK